MDKGRPILLSIILLLSSALLVVRCQSDVTSLRQDAVALYYARVSNLTRIFSHEMSSQANRCIVDPKTDFNMAFNYSSNLEFLATCMESQGDVSLRLCTAAEIKLYLNNVFKKANSGSISSLISNRNCNFSTWLPGCEPGWACEIDPTVNVDLQNSEKIPSRTVSCQACCEGFFCPQGLTCMMPCPLGAYCPRAVLNRTTSICEPYQYQPPVGHPNHTCGGANIWADVDSSEEIFCAEGSYCPTTVDKEPCGSGYMDFFLP
ncbi:hypothetical protein Nepgr_015150 [Nepenthes gracilis]|uniref:Uncharacterized protein n=1 Tax=Nepenthes gracilis TaxID=150966 RepID=A0AAD3SMD6_NEPGR|nr:hypothetical protein Nepgr_015150 [Nepenthes gracilis]